MTRPPRALIRLVFVAIALASCLTAPAASAQGQDGGVEAGATGAGTNPSETAGSETTALAGAIPEVAPPPELGALVGRAIDKIEVVPTGPRWATPAAVKSVRPGEPLTLAAARRAARELLSTGGYARATVEAEEVFGQVVLRVRVLPRRLVASVRIEGGVLDEDDTLRDARIAAGGELTAPSLPEIAERIRALYVRRGYPSAQAALDVRDTDDPQKVVLVVTLSPGKPREVARRIFVHDGPRVAPNVDLDAERDEILGKYGVAAGDRIDEELLATADRATVERLQAHGYHRAKVTHQLLTARGADFLYVRVDAGPKLELRYSGLRSLDADQIDDALELDKEPDRSLVHIAAKIRDLYVARGFLDAEVVGEERGTAEDRVHFLHFDVKEHEQVRVAGREFPCMAAGPLTPADARREIDSFLTEELPGGGLGPVDPRSVDALFGPTEGAGTRTVPLDLRPEATYAPDTYDRATKHVQDYLRSEGYLSATVGPLERVRRQCERTSPPGVCRPVPLPVKIASACLFDPQGLPMEEPAPDPRLYCVPDPARGVTCEPRLWIRLPIKLGPRTVLYDVAFEGNRDPALFEKKLEEVAEIALGDPVSQLKLEAARRRVLDAFKEKGYAFAEVRSVLDFSPDRTRARLRFVISEGERVVVEDVIVRGNKRTDGGLILRRVAFEKCPHDRPLTECVPYRPSDVRKSEERIATLGVFSSVSVSLEDPYVPAKRKVVVIEVQERMPQYLDIKPGFSTGEGFRVAFEYGHRNVGGKAIALTMRVQLGYLPDPFILDPAVKANFDTLPVAQRLERRDTVSIVFPEIGLGPLIRFGVDGIDVRDNARDFGLTKEAAVGTFTFRPVRQFYTQLGASAELNDVSIFNGDTVQNYLRQAQSADLNRLLRAPDGTTFALAQRVSATWDRRDNPFGATRGTLLLGAVEHVHAFPAQDNPNTITSDFLRFTGTASGYVRLTEGGLAFALSLRGGRIKQLTQNSQTYPDRLFFLGGIDSVRGFLQDSMVPQDVAEQLLSASNRALPPDKQLTIDRIALRGGDVYVNPRAELRIPISGPIETGLFLDAGNVWVDPINFQPFVLRYASGAGLRIATPIGPIAFDYGINLNRRPWEDFGAFHFSIGLF